MNSFPRFFSLLCSLISSSILSSCGNSSLPAESEMRKQTANAINPHPAGTYEAFKWENYPGTTRVWKNDFLLAKATSANTKVNIDIGDQRGFLIIEDQVAMDYRVSTGRLNKYDTPTGQFRVTEKIRDKRSNLYGDILDANGDIIKSDADFRVDEIPEGGKFLGAPMLYWMRLTNDGIGMHKGNVNSRYASHGCIRSHSAAIPIIYEKTRIGTAVSIEP